MSPTIAQEAVPQLVATELGGLFFLLNIALARGLYGDFTTPAEPGITLDPWDFITLLGRSLLDEISAHDDPVWRLLATLAGRDEREPPGLGFTPPGFTPPEETAGGTNEDAAGALRRWVATLTADIRAQLVRDLRRTKTEVGPLLIRQRGRVTVTAAHLDVWMSLAELPIEVRLAGLDRDPGWIPATGRTLAFHFD